MSLTSILLYLLPGAWTAGWLTRAYVAEVAYNGFTRRRWYFALLAACSVLTLLFWPVLWGIWIEEWVREHTRYLRSRSGV